MLLLEGEIPGVLGTIMHFYVPATYGLQHPDSITADTFGGYDTCDEFADHVVRWARSVRETLDAKMKEERELAARGGRPPKS